MNTCIELPHDIGFKAIKFSNTKKCDNLLCATAGKDDFIKIWFLDESNDIYRKGKVWCCAGRTRYLDNQRLGAISFSEDGSLLAAGYENKLCLYRAKDLQLRTVLSCTGRDGVVSKVQINISNSNKSADVENNDSQVDMDVDLDIESEDKPLKLVAKKCERFLQLLNADSKNELSDATEKEMEELFNESGDDSVEMETDDKDVNFKFDFDKDSSQDEDIEGSDDEIECKIRLRCRQEAIPDNGSLNFIGDSSSIQPKLRKSQKSEIFKQVMNIDDLSFIQKLMVFQRLGIYGSFQKNCYEELCDTIKQMESEVIYEKIEKELYEINHRQRYKEALRFYQYKKMKDKYEETINAQPMSLCQVFLTRPSRRLRRGGGTRNHNLNITNTNSISSLPTIKKRKVESSKSSSIVSNQLDGDVVVSRSSSSLSRSSSNKEKHSDRLSTERKTGTSPSNCIIQSNSKTGVLPPPMCSAQIRNVEFCYGPYSNLVSEKKFQ